MVALVRTTANESSQFGPRQALSIIPTTSESHIFLPSSEGALGKSIPATGARSSYYLTNHENRNCDIKRNDPSFARHSNASPYEKIVVSDILEGITCLCLGSLRTQPKSPFSAQSKERLSNHREYTVVRQEILHSETKRLDNIQMVFERRKMFRKNLFRPISLDE